MKFLQNTLIVRFISGTCSKEQLVITKIRLTGCKSIVFQIYVNVIVFNTHADPTSLILDCMVILNTLAISYYCLCVMLVLTICQCYYNEAVYSA